MTIRFCPQCGTESFPAARFCHACGTALTGGAATATAARPSAVPVARRSIALGASVLGGFVVAGLAIWTAILSPTPPRPAPGAAGPRTAQAAPNAPAAGGGDLPSGHPAIPTELPQDVKDFIADLGRKAKEKPDDVAPWLTFARVNARAARVDPRYGADGVDAYKHVLEIDAKNTEALRGLGNLHYDREEHLQAIPYFERYLALKPDDSAAETDLATMYLYAGDPAKSVATYKKVLARDPGFIQAHYNLAVTYHQQGDDAAAMAELETARKLATDDDVRKQIDELLAALRDGRVPDAGKVAEAPPAADGAPRTPYQQAVEQAFRGHPIMGPRIVRFEWTSPVAGRVVVDNFPMDAMPDAVREKFTGRLADALRTAQTDSKVDGAPKMEIANSSGAVMATVTP